VSHHLTGFSNINPGVMSCERYISRVFGMIDCIFDGIDNLTLEVRVGYAHFILETDMLDMQSKTVIIALLACTLVIR
jgi:hypothetical protein